MQNPPNVSRMKLLPGLPLDQIGHAPGRPERSAIAQRLGTFLQAFTEFFQLDRLQAGFATRSCGFAQRFGALLFPCMMPAANRLAVNAQSPGYFSLMDASIKKPSGFEPSLFQFIKIALDAFWIAHARKLPRGVGVVTILCERQWIRFFK